MESVVSQRRDGSMSHVELTSLQCFTILLCGWLGGFGKNEPGKLLTIEEVGQVLNSKCTVTFNKAAAFTEPKTVPVKGYLLGTATCLLSPALTCYKIILIKLD